VREAGKPATLNEIMGSEAEAKSYSMKDLPELLGEQMPELPHNRVGRYRLLNALKIRFGNGYKNLPGVKNILNEFDKNAEFETVIKMNERSRNG
jgi:hypothetical protein